MIRVLITFRRLFKSLPRAFDSAPPLDANPSRRNVLLGANYLRQNVIAEYTLQRRCLILPYIWILRSIFASPKNKIPSSIPHGVFLMGRCRTKSVPPKA